MLFLELFCDVLHNERLDFDLAVLLRRWCILRNNLRNNLYTVREARHACYFKLCAHASALLCFMNSAVPVSRMFVTVCTVKKMWVGGYVTVIFHILSIRKH